MLKTHWLDGKHQCQIDHIIVTLVKGMVPMYEKKYECQSAGLDGKDLAGEQQQELLEHVAEIPSNSIQKFDETQFHVMSKSQLGSYHAVDLHQSTCECEDFPKIRFCRHITAILFHFPELSPPSQENNTVDSGLSPGLSPEETESQGHPQCVHAHRPKTLQVLTQDISMLSQTLAAESTVSQSTAAIEATCSAKHSLAAVIAAT